MLLRCEVIAGARTPDMFQITQSCAVPVSRKYWEAPLRPLPFNGARLTPSPVRGFDCHSREDAVRDLTLDALWLRWAGAARHISLCCRTSGMVLLQETKDHAGHYSSNLKSINTGARSSIGLTEAQTEDKPSDVGHNSDIMRILALSECSLFSADGTADPPAESDLG